MLFPGRTRSKGTSEKRTRWSIPGLAPPRSCQGWWFQRTVLLQCWSQKSSTAESLDSFRTSSADPNLIYCFNFRLKKNEDKKKKKFSPKNATKSRLYTKPSLKRYVCLRLRSHLVPEYDSHQNSRSWPCTRALNGTWVFGVPVSERNTILRWCPGTSALAPSVNTALSARVKDTVVSTACLFQITKMQCSYVPSSLTVTSSLSVTQHYSLIAGQKLRRWRTLQEAKK